VIQPVTADAPGRMSSHIVAQIQADIDAGRLKVGDRLPSERELAAQLNVSRVTLRDALRALEALGLVDIRLGARGGAFITAPSSDIIGLGLHKLLTMSSVPLRDIAEARLAVEMSTVALAIARADEDDLARLDAFCDEQAEELEAGDPLHPNHGTRFHALLADATHNLAVRLITQSFRGPLSMVAIRTEVSSLEGARATLREHRDIAVAMRQRDTRLAQDLLAAHLLRGVVHARDVPGIVSQLRGAKT